MNTPYQTPEPSSPKSLSSSGKKRLKSVSPLKAGIVLGALYAVLVLVVVVLMIPLVLLGAFSASESASSGAMGAGIGVGMLIFAPILYGVIGFIGGTISALIYNFIAKLTGGLEFTLEDV